MFTGRVVEPGEPLFLAEDTDAAIALAEEGRDTCPSCGYPKVWCRAKGNQFAFGATGERCHVTYALALQRHTAAGHENPVAAAEKDATQLSARFREGHQPDYTAGLDLPDDGLISDKLA